MEIHDFPKKKNKEEKQTMTSFFIMKPMKHFPKKLNTNATSCTQSNIVISMSSCTTQFILTYINVARTMLTLMALNVAELIRKNPTTTMKKQKPTNKHVKTVVSAIIISINAIIYLFVLYESVFSIADFKSETGGKKSV